MLNFDQPLIMGIVNVTPDSFSDGGRFDAPEQAIAAALRLVDEGADVLDIGGESTRPRSAAIDIDTEFDLLLAEFILSQQADAGLSKAA